MMLSALALARRIEAGELTPRAVIELCAEAIAAREADIGAFATLDLEGARRAAETSAAALVARPLRALPVGVKDIFDTADLPTEYNSPIYAGHRPRADASAVALVHRAGGIVIGKTVTTEFASLQPAATRNPHNPAHTPGGSSSGSAAGVAAGMFPIALGSQTGGSIVRPAAFCGVAGFKPSYKLLPTVGMKCVSWHLDTAGLFGAGIADVAFAAAAVTDRDLRVDGADPGTPRIALVRTHLWHEASAAMQQAVDAAARSAEAAGARVVARDLPPLFAEADRAHGTIADYEAYRSLAFEYDRFRDRLGPVVRGRLDRGATVSADDYDAARRAARRARRALADLMTDSGADVILTPSAPGAAPAGLATTGEGTFNRLWTLMGTPCINVPGLADSTGLPLGVQIVGRFGRDRAALAAAAFLERALVHNKAGYFAAAQ
jgi:Asp-tRNA(Asn)/Glu-tRNA(Gln) amidotransferase A subunit family amidase